MSSRASAPVGAATGPTPAATVTRTIPLDQTPPTPVEWPNRIFIDPRVSNRDAIISSCLSSGFDVLPSPVWSVGSSFLYVLPIEFQSTEIEEVVEKAETTCKPAHEKGAATRTTATKGPPTVYFISSVIFDWGMPIQASIDRYRKILTGIRCCPTAIDKVAKHVLNAFTSSLGCWCNGVFSNKLVHFVVAHQGLSAKYCAAANHNIPIVTLQWVEACFREGKVIPYERYPARCLIGHAVSCVGFDSDTESAIQESVTSHDGQFTPYRDGMTNTYIISAYPVPANLAPLGRNSFLVGRSWLNAALRPPPYKIEVSPANYPPRSDEEEEEREAARLKQIEADRARQAEIDQQRAAARIEQARLMEEAEAARKRQEEEIAEKARLEAIRKASEVEFDESNCMYLASMRIFLLALDSPAQTDQLHKIIQVSGGTRLDSLYGRCDMMHSHANANCTNMVLVYGSCKREVLDERVRLELKSKSKGVDSLPFPVVNYRWLLECYRTKSRVRYNGFELPPASDPSVTPAAAAATPTSTTAGGIFTARGPSPAPHGTIVRGMSAAMPRPAVVQRAPSIVRGVDTIVDELDPTLDVTVLRGGDSRSASHGHVIGDGAVNFDLFNQSLDASKLQSKVDSLRPLVDPLASLAQRANAALDSATDTIKRATAKPPTAPINTPAASGPLKQFASSTSGSTNGRFHLFNDLRFVVEDADADLVPGVDDSSVVIPPLRFSSLHRLTVLKSLTDYGAAGVFEPTQVKSATFKKQINFVITGVCGSRYQTRREQIQQYGDNARFASYFWVAACIKYRRLVDLLPSTDHTANPCWNGGIPRILPSTRVRGFAGLSIVPSGFSTDESHMIEACLKQIGATPSLSLHKQTDFLILCEQPSASTDPTLPPVVRSNKKETAWERGIRVVHPCWLVDALNTGCVVDAQSEEKRYCIPPTKSLTSAPKMNASINTLAVPDTPIMIEPDTPRPRNEENNAHTHNAHHTRAATSPLVTVDGGDSSLDSLLDVDVDDDGDGDDFGFTRRLQTAVLAAQTSVAAVPSPAPARATRTRHSDRVSAPDVSADAPSPVAAAEIEVKPLSAKAAFQQKLKQAKPAGAATRTRRESTLRPVDEGNHGDDDGDEAEAPMPPLPLPPMPDADTDLTKSPISISPSSPALKPFQTRRNKAPGSGSSDPPLSLSTARAVIAPILRVTPSPKKFKKFNKTPRSAAKEETKTQETNQPTTAQPALTDGDDDDDDESIPAPKAAPAGRVRRRIHLSQDTDPDPDPAPVEHDTDNNADPIATPSRSSSKRSTRSKPVESTPNVAHEQDEDEAHTVSKRTRRSTPKQTPIPADQDASTPSADSVDAPSRVTRKKTNKLPPPTATPNIAEEEGDDASEHSIEHGAAVERKITAHTVAPADPTTPVKSTAINGIKSPPSADPKSAQKSNLLSPPPRSSAGSGRTGRSPRVIAVKSSRDTPLRSPSLGGFPDPSLDAKPKKPRMPTAKRTYAKHAANEDDENDDPFAFDIEDGDQKTTHTKPPPPETSTATTQIQLTETQVLPQQLSAEEDEEKHETTKQTAEKTVDSAPLSSDAPVEPSTTVSRASRSKRKPAASIKSHPSDADVPAASDQPAPPPMLAAEPVSSTRAARKKRQADVYESPQPEPDLNDSHDSSAAGEIVVTENSITPPPSPSAKPLPFPDLSSPPPPRTASKRQRAAKEESSLAAAPSASPLKRTLSLKAVESLAFLKDASVDAAAGDLDDCQPASKKQKTSKRAAAAAAATAIANTVDSPSQPMELDDDTPAERPSRKRKHAAQIDGSHDSTPKADNKKKGGSKKQPPQSDSTPEVKDESPEVASPSPAKRGKKAASSANSATPKLFTLSGIHTHDRSKYVSIIDSLGGRLVPDSEIDFHKLTHIICDADGGGLKRSEKVLVALMSKHYLLHPSFLDACQAANKFVDERPYEWIRHAAGVGDAMMPAIKRWHKGAVSPYSGWRCAPVGLDANKLKVFRTLLEFGGGCIVDEDSNSPHAITHILVNTECKTAVDLKKKDPPAFDRLQAILAAHDDPSAVSVVKHNFLTEYLAKAGDVDIEPWRIRVTPAVYRSASSIAASPASTPSASASASGATNSRKTKSQKSADADAEEEETTHTKRPRKKRT